MNADDEAKAKQRFVVLNLVRLSGALMLAFGLAVIGRGFMDLPKPVGYILFFIGITDFLIVPLLLAKRWKSPQDL
jgi:hypothetical protein